VRPNGKLDAASEKHAAETASALEQVLEKHRGERQIAALQDYPDPDAISSAFVHKLISAEHDINVDIVYGGRVSHQQNIALVKLLGITLLPASELSNLSLYQGSIFVDGQGTNSALTPRLMEAGVPPIAIVDHHTQQEQMPVAEFVDIRHVGATASIYAGYLQTGILKMDRSHRDHVVAATALMHGIMTDTNHFVNATEEDFGAAAFLSRYFNAASLMGILSQPRTRKTMDTIQLALQNRILRENYSIAGIGYVRAAERDAIPQAADFLLTEENVHTAVVYGIVIAEQEGQRVESLVGSLRTNKMTLAPDAFIKEVFGRSEAGQFYGGGRTEAGAFEIPIRFLTGGPNEEFERLKWQVFDLQVKQKLFAKIGVKD
jgi:nanoRNase/pAp phosphatase (c-di-AMP/oligoRNAs hydrolase)